MGDVVNLPVNNPDALQVTFEDFWKKYPRRVAKKDAEKAWRAVDPAEHEKLMLAIDTQKRSEQWKRDNGQYVPYPASWLRGERWNDELEGADLTMGECCWNRNGNREPGKPKCSAPATKEKNGVPYCDHHHART